MQFLTTTALLATIAATALAAPASSTQSTEEVSVTKFTAKHIPHSADAIVDFYVKHVSGADVNAPTGEPAKEIHCHHEQETHSSNGLATFTSQLCDAKYSFAFQRNAEEDYVLTITDGAGLVGTKKFGKGMFYKTEGNFEWQYIASKGYFDVQLTKP